MRKVKNLINKQLFLPVIAGLVLSALAFGLATNKSNKISKSTPPSKSLVFQRQFIGQNQFAGEIKGVMKTELAAQTDGGRIKVSRGASNIEFTIPINSPVMRSQDVGLFQSSDISFASSDKFIAAKYSLIPDGIKEEIILNKIPKENRLPIKVKVENLDIKLTSDDIPVFYDKSGNYQFHFERPYLKDGAGIVSYGIKYKFVQADQKSPELFTKSEKGKGKRIVFGGNRLLPASEYVLYIEIDSDWLHDPKRVLPIVIDPTVVHDTTSEFSAGKFNRNADVGTGYITGATGGTVTNTDDGYTVHTFTTPGTFSFTPSVAGNVEVLVVGGGGGGGETIGGGGGAGGVIYNSSYAVTTSPVTVTVGGGGNGAPGACAYATGGGASGGNSVFGSLTATGGGGGGNYNNTSSGAANGGSGGGIGAGNASGATTGVAGQGSAGGISSANTNDGAGGGGASSPGGNGTNGTAGAGGTGNPVNISGSMQYYGGGGGGGGRNPGGNAGASGGLGGGGAGGYGAANGTNGTANTGGGGGGGGYQNSPTVCGGGGNGGSGVVIIRYPTNPNLATNYQELTSDQHTVGLWHMNEASGSTSVADSSGFSNTGTSASSTNVEKGVIGNARSFNNTVGTKIDCSTTGFKATAPLTLEAWAYFNSDQPGDYDYVVQSSTYANTDLFNIARNVDNRVYTIKGGTALYGPALPAGRWLHLAMVYDSVYPYVRFYLNGREEAITQPASPIAPTAASCAIGYFKDGNTHYMNGRVDEVRISNVARSAEEIRLDAQRRPYSVFTSDIIDGTKIYAWNSLSWTELGVRTSDGETLKDATGLIAQWNFNETSGTTASVSAGSCGTNCNGTLTAFSSTGSQDASALSGWTANNKKWGAGALMFDKTDDYILTTYNAAQNPSSSNLSVEAWVNPRQMAALDRIVGTSASNTGWRLRLSSSSANSLELYIGDGSTYHSCIKPHGMTPGNWYMVAATYNGSVFNLYVNGKNIGSCNDAFTPNYGTGALAIGGAPEYWGGVIDSIRIYGRVLSGSEILANYNATNLELQTRVGDTTNPDDGTWEDWKPITSETSVDDMESYSPLSCSAVGGTTTDGGKTYVFTSPKTVFKYTAKDQTYTVPAGVTSINVKMWGGGGGGGATGGWSYGFAGGGGGYTTGDIAVTPGQVLNVIVGAAGTNGWVSSNQADYGGGGRTCNTGADCRYGGQGGGRSAISYGGGDLLTAGGGGGGGSSRVTNGQQGGAGGGNTGVAGSSFTAACGGGGGGQASGGTAGTCANANGTAGAQYAGGNPASNSYGGSGGGGWYGGGGGGYGEPNDMGGGGGGSGYIGGAGVSNASTTAGSGATPGGSADADRAGAGNGGAAAVIGTPGRVVISINQSSPSFTCTSNGNVEVLAVAGGGGGGFDMGGGGGGGGVIYKPSYAVTANTPVSVTVGNGGRGAPPAAQYGQNTAHQYTVAATNGENTVFGSLTAIGGGAGGSSYYAYTPGPAGAAGGSGGGASGYSDGTTRSGGAGTPGQGYAGGNGGGAYYSGGGGGAGGPGTSSTARADGGIGFYSDILGTGYYWGGGGGGAGYSICGGNGGAGGGGGGAVCTTTGGDGINPGKAGGGGITGAQTNAYGGDAGANTGGGGGAGSHYNMNNGGGDGGSGIVVVRLSPFTKDTITKMEQNNSQKFTPGRIDADANTVGLWHFDETGGTGAYLKNTSGYTKSIFTYTGADQTYTVPAGVTSINVKMWGGGGGAGNLGGWTYGYDGGGAGFTTGDIAVTPGQQLTVMVGAGGNSGANSNLNSNYGGGGPNCNVADCQYGGQGGGRSAIRSGGADLLTAGGGGGGGSTLTITNDMSGGAGGGLLGHNGRSDNSGSQGFGASQVAGGAGGTGTNSTGTAGSQYQGGKPNTNSYGGSGGGGWYGGGAAGYTNSNAMGGGGGGSGYIGGTGVSNASTSSGLSRQQANFTDPDNAGAGYGGGGSARGYTGGANGRVIITTNTNASIANAAPTGTTVVDGISGKARSFNGTTSDFVIVSASPLLDLQNFTIEEWVYSSNFNQQGFIFEKTTNGSVNTQYSCFFNNTDTFYFRTFNTAAAQDDLNFTTSSYFKNNQWNHVACTYNGATKAVYVNGVLAASKAYAQTLATNGNGTAIIGAYGSGTAYNFNGKIDEVRVSNIARTIDEIAQNYRTGRDKLYTKTLTQTDLSGKNTIPFYVAADRPGTYLEATLSESSYANNQGDANTVGVYHLSEQTGTGAYIRDNSGFNNFGTPTGTTFTRGKIGMGRYFDGSNDFIDLGSNPSIDFGNNGAFTYAGWVKPTALVDYAGFVSKVIAGRGGTYSHMTTFMANGRLSAYTGAAWVDICPAGSVTNGNWYHVAYVYNGTTIYGYVNGSLCGSAAFTYTDNAAYNMYIGSWYSPATSYDYNGIIDEVTVSNSARTAENIRQMYDAGLRSHPITIDFAAKLDSGNLIADNSDHSFTIDATVYGLSNKGSKLYPGDKIIVRENYDGTDYIAQGNVSAVNESTGAVTVVSWDSGSTFPTSGYTANASVFKWQREYWNINEPLDSELDTLNYLTVRVTDGNAARTVWLDDFKSIDDYLTNPAGSTIPSSTYKRYFQYRVIESSSDENVSSSLTSVTLDYTVNSAPNLPTLDAPTDGATDQTLLSMQLKTTASDANSDNVQYKIDVCEDLAMTTNCHTYDQSSTPTGWSGMNADGNTTYSTTPSTGTQATYTFQSNLTAGTTYYWRSYAIDPAGLNTWSSTQSPPHSFRTSYAPSAPILAYAEGAINPTGVIDTTPEFSAVENDPENDSANFYEIQVNTQSDFLGTSLWDSGKTAMATTANGMRSPDVTYAGTPIPLDGAGTTYYWRIKFWDVYGAEGLYTAAQSFTMNAKPGIPTLDSPINTATNQSTLPQLKTTSTDADSNNLKYKIKICKDTAMSIDCLTYDQSSVPTGWSGMNADGNTTYSSTPSTGTQATYSVQTPLNPSTTYYWKSYAIDPSGSNIWSDTQVSPNSFTTSSTNYPTSCRIEKSVNNSYLTVKWTDNSSNEVNYEIQQNEDNGGFALLQTLAPNTQIYQDNSTTKGHSYQYRVAAIFNGSIYSQWCTTGTVSLPLDTNTFSIN